MQTTEITKESLFDACRVLFGGDIDVSVAFLSYLRPQGVKTAFRRKALEIHPDRAASSGGDPSEMGEQFKELNAAYRKLCEYVENRSLYDLSHDDPMGVFRPGGGAWAAEKADHARQGVKWPPPNDWYHAGPMPSARMPLGRFIYYSGAISYRELINSIVWQHMQHRLIGAVACDLGWLSGTEVLRVLTSRVNGEKFGDSAVRQGLLTAQQIGALMGEQRRRRPQIGEYFVRNKVLSQRDLHSFLTLHHMHNQRHGHR